MKHFLLFIIMITTLSGCTMTHNKYNLKSQLPGDSKASFELQKDALPTVYSIVAHDQVKPCKNMTVVDTKVIREPYDVSVVENRIVSARWSEEWTVKACEESLSVHISFVQFPSGTTFYVNREDISNN